MISGGELRAYSSVGPKCDEVCELDFQSGLVVNTCARHSRQELERHESDQRDQTSDQARPIDYPCQRTSERDVDKPVEKSDWCNTSV